MKEKVVTMANRLARHYPRNEKYLKFGHTNPEDANNEALSIRSRRIIRMNFWKLVDKKDFGDQLAVLRAKIIENPQSEKFDLKRAVTWAKFERRKISNKIRQRSATL